MEDDGPWLFAKKTKQTTLPTMKVARRIPNLSPRDLQLSQTKVQKKLDYFLKPKLMDLTVSGENLNYSKYLLESGKAILSSESDDSKPKAPQGKTLESSSEKSPFAVTFPLTDSSRPAATNFVPKGSSETGMNDIRKLKRKYGSRDELKDEENGNQCFECGKSSDGPCYSCVYKSSQFYETGQWRDEDDFETARTHVSESVSSEKTHVSETIDSYRTHTIASLLVEMDPLRDVIADGGPFPNISYNATSSDVPRGLTLGFVIAAGIGLYVLAVATFVGNAMVLHAIRTEKRLQTVSNMFIMSLAVADLIVGLIVMPISALYFINDSWPFGNAVCEIWLSVDYTASTASIFNLFVLSLDRYWSITSPLRYLKRRTRKRALVLIGLAWALSSVWLVPVTSWHWLVQNGERRNEPHTCDTEFSNHVPFKVTAAVINFYVPSVLMIYLYGRIFYEIRKRSRSEIGQVGVKNLSSRLDKIEEKPGPTRRNTAVDDDSNDSVDSKNKDDRCCMVQDSIIDGSCSSSSNSHRMVPAGQYRSLTLLTIPLSLCQDERYCTVEDCQFFGKVDVHIEYIRDGDSKRFSSDRHIKHKHCYASHVRKDKIKGWRYQDSEPAGLRINNARGSASQGPKGNYETDQRQPKVTQALLHKEKKAARQLGVIMGAFLLCWLPYFISFMVIAGCSECIPQKIYLTTIWLGYMNSALNPILYPLCNVHFRRAFARMLSFRNSSIKPKASFASSQLMKCKNNSNNL